MYVACGVPSAMAAQKNVFGLVDPGREIRRPPLVGMQFLHQRAVRARDRPRRSRPAAGQGSDRPPLPSFCRWTAKPRPAAASPCACSRQAGSRRSRYARSSARLSSSIAGRSVASAGTSRLSRSRALVRAGGEAAAHRAGVVVELHLEHRRAHARGLPAALLRALREAGRRRTAASRAGRGRTRRAGCATPSSPRKPRNTAKPSARRPPRGLHHARGDLRIDLGDDVERPQAEHQRQNAENENGHDLLQLRQQRLRAGDACRRQARPAPCGRRRHRPRPRAAVRASWCAAPASKRQ